MIDNKEALINQLASSMGVNTSSLNKGYQSRYDKATGTLYCNGYIITHNIIEDTKREINNMQARIKVVDYESRYKYMMTEVALQAIKLMEAGLTNESIKEK